MPHLSIVPQMYNKLVCVQWEARKDRTDLPTFKNFKKKIPFLPGAASLDSSYAPTLVPRGLLSFFWSWILDPNEPAPEAQLPSSACDSLLLPGALRPWEAMGDEGTQRLSECSVSGCIRCCESVAGSRETAKQQLPASSMLRHWLTNKQFLFWIPWCLNLLFVTSTVQIIYFFINLICRWTTIWLGSFVPGKAWGLQGPEGCDSPAPLCAVLTDTPKCSPGQRTTCFQKGKKRGKKKRRKKAVFFHTNLGDSLGASSLPADGDPVAPELLPGSEGAACGRGLGAGGTSPTAKELTFQQHPAALCTHCFLPKYNQLLTPNPQT